MKRKNRILIGVISIILISLSICSFCYASESKTIHYGCLYYELIEVKVASCIRYRCRLCDRTNEGEIPIKEPFIEEPEEEPPWRESLENHVVYIPKPTVNNTSNDLIVKSEVVVKKKADSKLERHRAIVRIGIVSVSVSLTVGFVLATLSDLRLIWWYKRKLKKNRRKGR